MSHSRVAVGFLCLAVALATGCVMRLPAGGFGPATPTLRPTTTSAGAVIPPATATLAETLTPTAPPPSTPTDAATATVVPSAPPTDTPTTVPAPGDQATPTLAPAQPPSPTLSLTQLKFVLVDQFGAVGAPTGIFYCDPDLYPVARSNEQALAEQWYASADKTSEELTAILEHAHIPPGSDLSPEQQLVIYRVHKLLNAITFQPTDGAFHFTLRIFNIGTGKALTGTSIEGVITPRGQVTVSRRQPVRLSCPICLALGTRIATPQGSIAVQDIQPGMLVWTVNAYGERVAAPVVKTSDTPVPAGFQIIHLRLSDGRELHASPGHPTADGRTLGILRPGDRLDGARVLSAVRTSYSAAETYDLLPAGGSGFYWADGVLVGSTLVNE